MKNLFNSSVEVGVRLLVILDAFYPRRLDLVDISIFDYFVVHTGDIGGPVSIHPDIDSRTGEFAVRRRVILESIELLLSLHLIEKVDEDTGVIYSIKAQASSLLDLMSTQYNVMLRDCAGWLADESARIGNGEFEKALKSRIGQWQLSLGLPATDNTK